ncbi:hypothetical protein Tco_0507342, partial [Tanacetum coccineum]
MTPRVRNLSKENNHPPSQLSHPVSIKGFKASAVSIKGFKASAGIRTRHPFRENP